MSGDATCGPRGSSPSSSRVSLPGDSSRSKRGRRACLSVSAIVEDLIIDFFERVAELRREGQSFAVATVVGRRAPVSAHLGDRAIVFTNGRMEGFIGGACSREIIRQQ